MTAYLILGGFLLVTLVLGLWAGKDVKTMKDYVLANRELSTSVVTMSLLATFFGSYDIDHPHFIFRMGIIEMIVAVCFIISFLAIGMFIAPHMIYFQDCLTTGDLMYKFYGRGAQLLTGILGCYFSVNVVAYQLRAIGYLNSELLGLSSSYCILGVGLIVVIYTSLSGSVV